MTAAARAPSAVHGHIRGTGAEFEGYNAAVWQRGEIGVQRPGRVNEGGPDFITARRNANGDIEVIVSDATINRRKIPKPIVPKEWKPEVREAVSVGRLRLNDPVLEEEIRSAVAAGRVRMRTLQVRARPEGHVTIEGW